MKIIKLFCLFFSSLACMAEAIPNYMKDVIKNLTSQNIVEHFFALEIENLLELNYSENIQGDLTGDCWECEARNIFKNKFEEFYGIDGWKSFKAILVKNLKDTTTDMYEWENEYSDDYDPDYPKKLTEEFQKKYSTSSGSLNSSASLSSSESENI